MTRVLTAPGVIDLGELAIVKGLFYWKIGIDIQVFGDNGNVYDLAMLSVVAALHPDSVHDPREELRAGREGLRD